MFSDYEKSNFRSPLYLDSYLKKIFKIRAIIIVDDGRVGSALAP